MNHSILPIGKNFPVFVESVISDDSSINRKSTYRTNKLILIVTRFFVYPLGPLIYAVDDCFSEKYFWSVLNVADFWNSRMLLAQFRISTTNFKRNINNTFHNFHSIFWKLRKYFFLWFPLKFFMLMLFSAKKHSIFSEKWIHLTCKHEGINEEGRNP
jgi:hypothetical protein